MTVSATCRNHAQSPADYTCLECSAPICETCVRTRDDGGIVCPSCEAGELELADEPAKGYGITLNFQETEEPPTHPCRVHPEMPSVAQCQGCGNRVCSTCDFEFANGLHLCPACVNSPIQKLTPMRKSFAIWSIVLAVGSGFLSIVGAALIFAAADGGRGAEIILSLVMVAAMGTSLLGFLLGIYSLARKSHNPFWLWFAPVVNILICAVWMLVLMLGLFAIMSGE